MEENNLRNKEDRKIKEEKMLIIGGGPAGLTAAIYGARAGLKPIVLMGAEPGGQITTSPEIENFPGFPGGINGFELMKKVIEQAESLGARLTYELVSTVDFSSRPYCIKTDANNYYSETVIIATGASPRKLGLKNEKKLVGSGVSYCATCDGAFFKDQVVAVIGGGDVALEDGNYLSKFCKKVYIIHRRDRFRGTKILGDRVLGNSKIEVLWDTELREIFGDNQLKGIIIENNKNGVKSRLTDVKGLFIAIGHKPNTILFKDFLKLDEKGFIITDSHYMTSREGVFAAGDVQDPHYQQVVTSAGDGAAVAIEATRYLDTYN